MMHVTKRKKVNTKGIYAAMESAGDAARRSARPVRMPTDISKLGRGVLTA